MWFNYKENFIKIIHFFPFALFFCVCLYWAWDIMCQITFKKLEFYESMGLMLSTKNYRFGARITP